MTSSPVLAILKLQYEKVRISEKNRLMSIICTAENWIYGDTGFYSGQTNYVTNHNSACACPMFYCFLPRGITEV